MNRAPLVIVTGPPGAGKTTVSRLVASRFEPSACVLESDWWWTTLVKGGIEPWLPEAYEQNRTVVRSFTSAARVMAEGGYPTVLDGVVGPWMLDVVAAETEPERYAVHYVVLRPTLDETVRRATGRHGVERVPGHPALTDEEPVRQLWQEFSDLGAYERHVLDTSVLDAQAAADAVWEMVAGDQARLGTR